MNGGVALCIDVDPVSVHRRIDTRYLDEVADSYADAVARCIVGQAERSRRLHRTRRQRSRLVPRLLADGFAADIVTDQTSAHDPLSYIPMDLSLEAANQLRREAPETFIRRARESMARHCEAMVGFKDGGAEVFDYGNSLRAEALLGGFARAFEYEGSCPPTSARCSARVSGRSAGWRCRAIRLTSLPPIAPCWRSSPTTTTCTSGSAWRVKGGVPGPARAHLLARVRRSAIGSAALQRDGGERRAEGADRDRARPSRFGLGGLSVPRD